MFQNINLHHRRITSRKTPLLRPLGPDYGVYGAATPGHDRLLFFGYIRRYKRLDLLLEAFRTLANAGVINLELVVAGSCDDWGAYQQLINDRMRIDARIGMVANKDIPDLVSSCHYLILPYQDATQSGVLSLAYHYNKPVIASDIEAFADDVIPGRTGYVFKSLSHDSLVSVLKAVSSQHESAYEALTQNVREFRTQHSLESRVADYRWLLDLALQAAGRQPALLGAPTSV